MSMISTRINQQTFPLSRTIFDYVALNTQKGKTLKCVAPLLSYIFVESVTSKDMRMPVISDYPGIVLFAKSVAQKSPPHKIKRGFYSIGLVFCSYLHYESGTVLDNSIFDLWLLDREYVESYVFFAIGNDIVDLSTVDKDQLLNVTCFTNDEDQIMIEPTISEFIKLASKDAYLILGYYIKNSSYDYVHCFLVQTFEYKNKPNFYGIIDKFKRANVSALDLNEEDKFEIIKDIIKCKGIDLPGQISACKTSQAINIEIAQFMCECLTEFFFDLQV